MLQLVHLYVETSYILLLLYIRLVRNKVIVYSQYQEEKLVI